MPLIIGKTETLSPDYDFTSTRQLFADFPELKESTNSVFNAGPESAQTYDSERDPVLYVMQGETAIVSPRDDTIQIVMTDDTTTCITGIIRHCNSGVTSLTHFDRPLDDNLLVESLEAALTRMICLGNGGDSKSAEAERDESDAKFDLYLIGGYCDEKRISEDLAIYLLKTFNSLASRFTINLVCAFTGELNTRSITISTGMIGEATIPAPVVYGSAINLQTGAVVSALLNRRNGNGIPLFDIRRASVSFGNAKKYWDVYDPERKLLVVHPVYFDIQRSPQTLHYFNFAIKLKDQDILKKFSTSPYVEPPHFVSDIRGVFKFFLDHHNRNITRLYFPTEQPRYFRHYRLYRSTPTAEGDSGSQYRWKECSSTTAAGN